MTTIGILTLSLCLFCGAFGQLDVNEMNIEEALSYLSEGKDTKLDEMVAKALAKLIDEQWYYTDEIQPSLRDDLDLNDDLDDVIKLELADSELVGGCKGGSCHYCGKIYKFEVCLDAKLVKLGFDLTITVAGNVIFHKQVTVQNPPPVCVKTKIGKACVTIYDVDLKKKSACVKVSLTVKIGPGHKTFTIKLKCFHLKTTDEAMPHPFLQLMKALVTE